MRFEVKACFADYIQFNIKQRWAASKEECRRKLHKLMNVAPYGKKIKNVANRKAIKIFSDMEKARRIAEKPQCINFRVFNPDLVAVESRKANQVINKPLAVGFAVLEHNKPHMSKTYASLKDKFDPPMCLLYRNIDSLILQFFPADLYPEQLDPPQVSGIFDFSDIPANHSNFLTSPNDLNKGQVGFFKDKKKGNSIIDFVAWKLKMYSFKVDDCQ